MAGDQAAYRQLLQRLAVLVRAHVRRRLARYGGGPDDVEDVVQDVLLAVHLKRQTWDERLPLEPWVRGIATYKLIDHLRRRGYAAHVDFDDVAEELSAEESGDGSCSIDRDRLLATLSVRQRRVVEAIAIEGFSAREVAKLLDMTESAVRVALHRAIKAMSRKARGGGA
jgi:RNA polymerase sigma-70 factor (ECF subfamily)